MRKIYTMLISQPILIIKQWLAILLLIMTKFSLWFPKLFCISTLTWGIYVVIWEACYKQILMERNAPILSGIISLIGIGLYGLCVVTYFKVVEGGGSPLDFQELRIRDVNKLKLKHQPNDHNQPTVLSAPMGQHTEQLAGDLIGQEPEPEPQSAPEIPDDEQGEQDTLLTDDVPPTEFVDFHMLKPGVSPYRYCEKCKVWKPDRCHHCSSCNRCVLRMDHHCPWYATCIGYHNQKFFIQSLAYVSIFSGYCCLVSLALLWGFFVDEGYTDSYLSLNLVFLFIIGLAFWITVGLFALFLLWLVIRNTTTIEMQDIRWIWGGDNRNKFQYEFDANGNKQNIGNIFDLGFKRNFKSVMGPNIWYWLLPLTFTHKQIHSRYNGINYDINDEVYEKWCYNIKLQEQLNHQLNDYRERLRRERFT